MELNTPVYEDFVGFSFNGVHSSQLGIKRTSDGSRFNENLLPSFQDKSEVVQGGNGTYYWNSFFTQTPISIPIAFDCLTEPQMSLLQSLMASTNLYPLIFDETPYKYYMVKAQGTPQLKYICFNETETITETTIAQRTVPAIYYPGTYNATGRLYKGEGTLSFVAYYPFAMSRILSQEEMIASGSTVKPEYHNKDEWLPTINLPQNKPSIINATQSAGASVTYYNAGQRPMDWVAYVNLSSGTDHKLYLTNPNSSNDELNADYILELNNFTLQGDDVGVCVNSKTNLIQGYTGTNPNNYTISSNLYNKYVKAGQFFKIAPGAFKFVVTGMTMSKFDFQYLFY